MLKSKAQYRRLLEQNPEQAERWKGETPDFDDLPERVEKPAKAAASRPTKPAVPTNLLGQKKSGRIV